MFNLLTRGRGEMVMTRFTEYDWSGWAGATCFADGTWPFIGWFRDDESWTIIIDRNGVELNWMNMNVPGWDTKTLAYASDEPDRSILEVQLLEKAGVFSADIFMAGMMLEKRGWMQL